MHRCYIDLKNNCERETKYRVGQKSKLLYCDIYFKS